MSHLDLIKDDTVCDITNVSLLIKKICRCVGDQSFPISRTDKTDAIKGYCIDFDETGHKIFLVFGDTWKRTQKFLDLPPQADITCPICLDVLIHKRGARVLTCHECLIGVCGDCTLQQFVVTRGVMICRNCRHSVGEPKPAYQVAGMVEVMRRGLACGFKG
jgi:ribosomal protein L37AE/L43A